MARSIRSVATAGTLAGFAWGVALPLLSVPEAGAGVTGRSPDGGLGLLGTIPVFFALATLVNAALAARRVGASMAGAVTVAAFGAALAAIIAWLLVFWMRLDGGGVWKGIGWTGLALLLLGNLGVGRWAATVRQLPSSPANFHVGL